MNAEREVFLDRLELGAVERGYAYVAGEVGVPQRVPLPFENTASLADVLLFEGGRGIEIQFGDYSEIYVLRRSTDPEQAGSLLAYHLDANNAANLSLASMFEMHPGDVVFVAEQPITAWNRTISQVLPNVFTSLVATVTRF
jgi:polysaccharide export outer membrane protein